MNLGDVQCPVCSGTDLKSSLSEDGKFQVYQCVDLSHSSFKVPVTQFEQKPVMSGVKQLTANDFMVFHEETPEDHPTQEQVELAEKEDRFILVVAEGPIVIEPGDDMQTLVKRFHDKYKLKPSPVLIVIFVLNIRRKYGDKTGQYLRDLAHRQIVPKLIATANARLNAGVR